MPTETKEFGVFRFGSEPFYSSFLFFYWWCFGVELLRGEGVFTENTIQVVEARHTGGGSLNF